MADTEHVIVAYGVICTCWKQTYTNNHKSQGNILRFFGDNHEISSFPNEKPDYLNIFAKNLHNSKVRKLQRLKTTHFHHG